MWRIRRTDIVTRSNKHDAAIYFPDTPAGDIQIAKSKISKLVDQRFLYFSVQISSSILFPPHHITSLFPFDGRTGRKYASACAPEKVV